MHFPNLPFLLAPFLYNVVVSGWQASAADDLSVLATETAKANNDSLLWGPYKSNLYFGVRPRIANSLSAGLMWAKVDNYATAQASMFGAPQSAIQRATALQ
jgi:mannosyl-oligosaccharide glucosidase